MSIELPIILLLILLVCGVVLSIAYLLIDLIYSIRRDTRLSQDSYTSSLKVLEKAKLESLQIITRSLQEYRKNARLSEDFGKDTLRLMDSNFDNILDIYTKTLDGINADMLQSYTQLLTKESTEGASKIKATFEDTNAELQDELSKVSTEISDSFHIVAQDLSEYKKNKYREADNEISEYKDRKVAEISRELSGAISRTISRYIEKELPVEVKEEVLVGILSEAINKLEI